MSLTIPEICDKLSKYDEITLLELLEISSEDIVEMFVDKIIDRADQLEQELEDIDEEFDNYGS